MSEPGIGEIVYRVAFAAVLFAGILISAVYRTRARRTAGAIPRSAESVGLRLLRALLSIPILLAALAYMLRPDLLAWSRLSLPDTVRLAGVLLGGVAAALTFWVLRSLGTNVSETVLTKPEQTLITHGPYAYVRHPLYTTGLLLLVALGLIAADGLILGLVVLSLLPFVLVIIPREEAALVDRFGDAYERYRARTGALVPRIVRR